MVQFKFCVLVAALSLIAATTALAETKSVVRRNNFFENATNSPWFDSDVGAAPLSASQDANQGDHTQGHLVVSKPSVTGIQAGQVTSVTVASNYSIQGWATEANSFNDLNGIPEGITVTFNTAMTFSVDAGNYLTLAPSAGNGLGITQTQGTSSNLDVGEILHVSDVQITDIAFTGSVPGYTFSNPTTTNFGIQVFRSGAGADFTEASENAGLYSVPPDVSGNPTIGFGDGALGTGVLQSNFKIDNGFDAVGTNFNRYVGAWDFKMLAGSMGLKGIGFQYNLGYDITPDDPAGLTGDYDLSGTVDAADYVLWREGVIAADGNNDTFVDVQDYDIWRANFGNTPAGSGAGANGGAVPEPAAVTLVVVGLMALAARRKIIARR